MNGHDHRAATERRQRADDERASVARPHADTLSFAHAEPVKLDAQRFDFAPERLVVQRAAGINDGGAIRPLTGGLGKRVENVHFHRAILNLVLTLNLSSLGQPDIQPIPHAAGPASCSESARQAERQYLLAASCRNLILPRKAVS